MVALVSERPIFVGDTKFASVKEFTKTPFQKRWLVIDPWLNTVCTADEYLEQGGRKLDQWTAQGKRVAWNHGSQGPAAYPPGGSNSEYKAAFEVAPVRITEFAPFSFW